MLNLFGDSVYGHILLIEDNETLGSSLVDNLQMESFSVDWITDGQEGLIAAKKEIHDLVILDLNLPKLDGLELLKQLRETSNMPVLILSARSQQNDKIQGLELAADDYLSKPFHFKELFLRIQNILRRTSHKRKELRNVKIGKALFDFEKLEVTVNNTTEKLSEKEAHILKLLITFSNQVVSREKILDFVWGINNYPSSRTIDNLIVQLRKWIEIDPQKPEHIISHRGIGYLLNLEESPINNPDKGNT